MVRAISVTLILCALRKASTSAATVVTCSALTALESVPSAIILDAPRMRSRSINRSMSFIFRILSPSVAH
jgi:hypothetical protein